MNTQINGSGDAGATRVIIDFLYSEDCPSHERALEMLRGSVREQGVDAEIRVTRVDTDQEARRLNFPGSPTIRVAGQDIEEGVESPDGLSCRAYRHPNGKVSPLPPRNLILDALRDTAG
jgi:hypothetical protein